MSITVEMSAPYLGLTHLVSAMAEGAVRANRSTDELQNPEEMLAAAALTWESKLRELAERRAIEGHDWDSLAAEDWLHLDIERDVFFVDDLNECEELTRVGFRFVVVASEQWQKDNLAILEEFLVNGEDGINWDYWVWKMRTLSTAEAARLVVGLDPDVFKDLSVEPGESGTGRLNTTNTASLRKRAFNIERLALREGRGNHSAFDWLLWVKEQGFEVHHGYSKAANEKKVYEDAVKALRELPPKEAAHWDNAEEKDEGRRQVTFVFAGLRSTQHFTLAQFVDEVSGRLARWRDGRYGVVEAAQVLADANPGVVAAESLCEDMEQALHAGQLALRRNEIPIPAADIPRGRLWNRYVRAEDVNDWLTASRARYRLAYPYDAIATAKPEERRVSDEDWKQLARTKAAEIIREHRARDLYPNQENIADLIAKGFREQGIVGADGKPLSGATIKRHGLKGISSAIGKQLSTTVGRGK